MTTGTTVPTPAALARLEHLLGARLRAEAVPLASLAWRRHPADERSLRALRRPADASPPLYLHPRRGDWEADLGPDSCAAVLLGVVEDAIAFVADPRAVPEAIWELGYAARRPSDRRLSELGADDFAGHAVLKEHGVGVWGPFAHAIPAGAERRLLAHADVRTAVLTAIGPRASDVRTVRIAHEADARHAPGGEGA